MELKGLIDTVKENARLMKEQETVKKEIDRLAKKLGNPKFLEKAPADVVEKEKAKLAVQEEKMKSVQERMKFLAELA